MVDVYITRSNYYKIVQSYQNYNSENILENLKNTHPQIQKIISEFNFSWQDILWYKTINHKTLYYIQKVENVEDSGRYIYTKGKKYVYHLYENCCGLNNLDYSDFKTPQSIVKKNDLHFTNNFREWFKSSLENHSLNEVLERYNSEFCQTHKLETIEGFEKISRNKSELKILNLKQNFGVKEKEFEVKYLIHQFKNTLGDDNLFVIKQKAYELIFEYFLWYFEKGVERANDYFSLDTFGLKHCHRCESKRMEEYNKTLSSSS